MGVKKIIVFLLLMTAGSGSWMACSGDGDADADSDIDADGDSDIDADSDADSEPDADDEAEPDADEDPDEQPDSEVEPDGDPDEPPNPPGDSCDDPINVDESVIPYTWSIDADPGFTHTCTAELCPGTSGPDVWHLIEVPAGQSLILNETPGGPLAYFAILDSCSATETLAYSGDSDELYWRNGAAEAVSVLVVFGVVDGGRIDQMEMTFDFREAGEGDTCETAIDMGHEGEYVGTGAWNITGDSFRGDKSCSTAEGAYDHWFSATVNAGHRLQLTNNVDSDPVIIQVVAGPDCGSVTCLAHGEDSVTFENTTRTDRPVFVIIENPDNHGRDINIGFRFSMME